MRLLPAIATRAATVILSILLVSAIFLRFWHFTDTLLFQGDQGRDALIVADIFRQKDLVFIGPVTSIGNMYLGPFYYYFMLPFLALSYPSPVGPAVAIALTSILTVYLLYALGKEIVGKRAALLAAFCYTFSAEIVRYSRFSWNPNLAPPVSFLLFWATYKAWKKSPWYWLVVAICFSILIQLHYMTLLIAGGIGIIWLIQVRELITAKSMQTLKQLLAASVGGILIFVVSLTPLILFDMKHDGVNRQGLSTLFNQEQAFNPQAQTPTKNKIQALGEDIFKRTQEVFFIHLLTTNTQLQLALLLALGAGVVLAAKQKDKKPLILVGSFVLPSLLGMSLYQASLFVHYIIFLYPIIFLGFGWILAIVSRQWWGKIIVIAFIALYLHFNLPRMPLTGNGWDIHRMKALTDELLTHLRPDEKYNIVLVSPTKDIYGPHYRYFLSTTDHPSLPAERGPEAETLVVINEAGEKDITSLPIYEIVIFPVKTPSEVYTIENGPEISIFRKNP